MRIDQQMTCMKRSGFALVEVLAVVVRGRFRPQVRRILRRLFLESAFLLAIRGGVRIPSGSIHLRESAWPR